MLVFAALTPHPLISIPDIEKERVAKIRKTMRSFRELANELYASKPDTIIVISPHPPTTLDAFSINSRPELTVEFSTYGNLSDRLLFTNDIGFGYKIRESVEDDIPVILTEGKVLDYGAAIPLFHLTRGLKQGDVRVVPIYVCALPLQQHYAFGSKINQQIHQSSKRIAVIASGDLAHGVGRKVITGYDPRAFAFNAQVRQAVERQDTRSLLAITPEELATVSQCGLASICVLLGILDQRRYETSVLSYDAALGVGYLCAQFKIR